MGVAQKICLVFKCCIDGQTVAWGRSWDWKGTPEVKLSLQVNPASYNRNATYAFIMIFI